MIPVILSGGAGTRLWPLSRKAYPKQFLPLNGEHSLLQDTAMRLQGLEAVSKPLVVCNEEHRFLVNGQLGQIGLPPAGILLEPAGRNTAPAIAAAALHAQQSGPEGAQAILLVMPSDHVIRDIAAFQRCIHSGQQAAKKGTLITFGIVADRPETGYGYIRKADTHILNTNIYAVAEFTEKPDLTTAQSFIKSGDYLWNSGIFMFRADSYLSALQQFRPDILEAVEKSYAGLEQDRNFWRLQKDAFTACPAESIDYAVMEKATDTAVIPMDAGWSDLGAWSELKKLAEPDEQGNITIGDTVTVNSRNNYIRSSKRLISTIGINDTIVIETADAVLVASQAECQNVKDVVKQLEADGREETTYHVCVYRPWGSFETIDEGPGFKVKRIIVNPGASLSLQMHHQRAEHWVVVRGEARVTRGEEIFTLNEDQSTYIPTGTRHRLENESKGALEIIEVQTGAYLGEDDIVRFDDVYGR